MMPKGVNSDRLASTRVELHSADDVYQQGGSFESGPMVAFWHENSLKPWPTIIPA